MVGWSRILAGRELLCVINTDPGLPRQAWVTVDSGLHSAGDRLQLLHAATAGASAELGVEARNGTAVLVTLPPGGFAVYA